MNRVDAARPHQFHALISAGCFAAAVVLLLGTWLPIAQGADDTLFITMLLGGVMVAVMTIRFGQSKGNLFDPLFLFTFVLLFYFVVHTVWFVWNPFWTTRNFINPFSDALPRSQLYFFVAYLLLLVGYAIPSYAQHSSPVRRRVYDVTQAPTMLLAAIFAAGMASNAVAANIGAFAKDVAERTTANNLLFRTFGYMAIVATIVGLAKVMKLRSGEGKGTKFLVYGVMLPVQLAWGLAVAQKMEVIAVLFAWAVTRNYLSRLISLKLALLGLVFFVFVVTPLVTASRTAKYDRARTSSLHEVRETFVRIPSRLGAVVNPEQLFGGFSTIQKRTNGSDSLALTVKYTPEPFDYQYGAPWIAIPLSFIPRFVWPSKPLINQTKSFSVAYAGQAQGAGGGLAVAPTIPGDLYRNLGVMGLCGGFFLLGMLLRLIERLHRHWRESPEIGTIVFVALMLPLMLVDRDVGATVSDMLLRLGIAAAVIFGITQAAARPSSSRSGRRRSVVPTTVPTTPPPSLRAPTHARTARRRL